MSVRWWFVFNIVIPFPLELDHLGFGKTYRAVATKTYTVACLGPKGVWTDFPIIWAQ